MSWSGSLLILTRSLTVGIRCFSKNLSKIRSWDRKLKLSASLDYAIRRILKTILLCEFLEVPWLCRSYFIFSFWIKKIQGIVSLPHKTIEADTYYIANYFPHETFSRDFSPHRCTGQEEASLEVHMAPAPHSDFGVAHWPSVEYLKGWGW